MTGLSVKALSAGRALVGESPLWDETRACLWWVDIAGQSLHRYGREAALSRSWSLPLPPGAIALDEGGTLVVAAGAGWYRFDPETGAFERFAALPDADPGCRYNDGAVDGRGRFLAGTVPLSREDGRTGELHVLDRGNVRRLADDLLTQNGLAFSPDGATMYLADSHPERCLVWAFDYDAATGTPSNRRVFHRPDIGRPDGAAVDAEGCYWYAAVDGGQIVRLSPTGALLARIELPVSRPTNLAFGGPDMRTIFVTSMRAGLTEDVLAREPEAGDVFAIKSEWAGLLQPRLACA